MLKLHLKKYHSVIYQGQRYCLNFDHWTTANTIEEGLINLRKQVSNDELFGLGYSTWKDVILECVSEDVEIIPVV